MGWNGKSRLIRTNMWKQRKEVCMEGLLVGACVSDIGNKKHPMEFKPASLSLVQKTSERGAGINYLK